MSDLPFLGDFDFLRRRPLSEAQKAELAPLAKRWHALAERWPRAGTLLSEEEYLASQDKNNEAWKVWRELGAFVRRHGLLEPQKRPPDPEAVREAIRRKRILINSLAREPIDWKTDIAEVWQLWRDRLSDQPPPEWPERLNDVAEAQAALDRLERELHRLFPPAANNSQARETEQPSSAPDNKTAIGDCAAGTEDERKALQTEDERKALQYVTLDQMAAIVHRSKRTLEKRKGRRNNPLPDPDVEGGGGRPAEWLWPNVRKWLEQEFGRQLPEQFPQQRPPCC
jgi:hypothetical protein